MCALTVAWASLFLEQAEVRRSPVTRERERERKERKARKAGQEDRYTEASDKAER